MNNKIVSIILAVFFIVVGLWLGKQAIGKKKWGTKRALLCIGGLGGLAAGGYCIMASRKF